MPAYLVAMMNVTNPEAYAEYRRLAAPVVQQYGGRYLARGGSMEVLEGGFPGARIVLVEFESVERAKRFYDSPEYRAAREKRLGAADFHMLLVEGS